MKLDVDESYLGVSALQVAMGRMLRACNAAACTADAFWLKGGHLPRHSPSLNALAAFGAFQTPALPHRRAGRLHRQQWRGSCLTACCVCTALAAYTATAAPAADLAIFCARSGHKSFRHNPDGSGQQVSPLRTRPGWPPKLILGQLTQQHPDHLLFRPASNAVATAALGTPHRPGASAEATGDQAKPNRSGLASISGTMARHEAAVGDAVLHADRATPAALTWPDGHERAAVAANLLTLLGGGRLKDGHCAAQLRQAMIPLQGLPPSPP
eukprot:CAMPEP_0206145810 /NCGR_PEP_ID=MMETSP1473-20131121/28577_1 /ASSEMBLY_ACC=CAM_ASM_001109 /TAXON_ID=1461547 /ORGANISM="Stichococcus sp, Strain RCC1054" /LENGTH=268 /DNA_ID=CAMNT_0053542167 /DNA_START=113 /DNA_END=917 /DNA_ORIENTATION=-